MSGDLTSTALLIALMVAAFYFLIIRPNRKRRDEAAKTRARMEPGARVVLASGIYGNIVRLGDKQAVVEVAPGIEVTVLKQVVIAVVTPESQYAEDDPASADDLGDDSGEDDYSDVSTHDNEPHDADRRPSGDPTDPRGAGQPPKGEGALDDEEISGGSQSGRTEGEDPRSGTNPDKA